MERIWIYATYHDDFVMGDWLKEVVSWLVQEGGGGGPVG